MKLIEMKCKNCGAILKVVNDTKEIDCQYCHANYKLDDETIHIKYDDMEQAGYDFEKGKIRAQQEHRNSNNVNYNTNNKKSNNTIWIILAWMFLLPFTATYYILKNKKLDKKKKIIIISIMWAVFFIVAYSNPSENTSVKNSNSKYNEEQIETINEEKYADDSVVDEFIKSFKSKSSMELVDIEKGNIGIKYYVHINGKYVELLNATEQPANYFHIVINGKGKTKEEIASITEVYIEIVKVLEPSLTQEKLNETIETYIKPEIATREFDLNDKIHINFYPSSGAGGYDCRMEINTTQYNK